MEARQRSALRAASFTILLMVVAAISFAVLSERARGEESPAVPSGVQPADASATDVPPAWDELQEKRTVNSNTYETPDGSFVTRIASAPVNFRDGDGELRPIDSSLYEQGDGTLVNGASSFDAELPADIDDPVSVERGGEQLHFELSGGQGDASVYGSTATYEDVAPGVDAVYTVGPDFLKEDLVLADPGSSRQFSFASGPKLV